MIYIKELIFIICDNLSFHDVMHLSVSKELNIILKEYDYRISKRLKYYDEFDNNKIIDDYSTYLSKNHKCMIYSKIDGSNGKKHGHYYYYDECRGIFSTGYFYNNKKEKCHKIYNCRDNLQLEKILLGYTDPISFCNYKNDILDGFRKDDDDDYDKIEAGGSFQIPVSYGTYCDGKLDGSQYIFSINNEYFLAEYNWDMGQLSGLSFEYNDGKVTRICLWYPDKWLDVESPAYDIIFENDEYSK